MEQEWLACQNGNTLGPCISTDLEATQGDIIRTISWTNSKMPFSTAERSFLDFNNIVIRLMHMMVLDQVA
jgi:hypothetical protein